MRLRTIISLFWLIAILLPACCPAQGAKAVPRQPMLTVLAQAGVTPTGRATGRCDFGQIFLLSEPGNGPGGKSRERVVTLRNAGTTPIEIERLESSCGCTTAMLPSEGGIPHTRLAPGEKIALRIALHTESLKPGPLHKWVWVRAPHQAQPLATLAITGLVQAPATFTPVVLDFGRVPAGEKRALRLTAAAPAGVASIPAWHLVSTNPDVRIEADAVPGDANSRQNAAGAALRTFTILLAPNAPLGRIEGALRLIAGRSDTGAAGQETSPANGGDGGAESGLSVPLAGEVSGSLSATPRVLVLGSTPAGRAVTRQVLVQGDTPDALQGLQISCASPSVSARLLPSAASDKAAATTVILAVTLADTAPAGGFQTDILVTTRTGQRLRIIVLGSVIASGK